MSVLVGYIPHKGGRGSLDLGLQFAHVLGMGGDAQELLSALELGWSVAGQTRPDGALELRRTY